MRQGHLPERTLVVQIILAGFVDHANPAQPFSAGVRNGSIETLSGKQPIGPGGQGTTQRWLSVADTAKYRADNEPGLAPIVKASGARVE